MKRLLAILTTVIGISIAITHPALANTAEEKAIMNGATLVDYLSLVAGKSIRGRTSDSKKENYQTMFSADGSTAKLIFKGKNYSVVARSKNGQFCTILPGLRDAEKCQNVYKVGDEYHLFDPDGHLSSIAISIN